VSSRTVRSEARQETGAPQGNLPPSRGVRSRDVARKVLLPIRKVSLVCAGLAAVIMAGLMTLQVIDVLVRNATGGSAVHGVPEYISVGMVFVVFLSIAHSERLGAHIRTPVLVSRLPKKVGHIARGAGLMVAACVIWALGWAALGRAIDAYDASEVFSGIARVPAWPARFAIPLGALLLGIELVARALMLDGEEVEEDSTMMEGSIL
jgi:TRAP-type C4-dicarboxylate transport system permease small subunit